VSGCPAGARVDSIGLEQVVSGRDAQLATTSSEIELQPSADEDEGPARHRPTMISPLYARWKYKAYSRSTAGFDVWTVTSAGTSSSASE
jgi:hypothetical protein